MYEQSRKMLGVHTNRIAEQVIAGNDNFDYRLVFILDLLVTRRCRVVQRLNTFKPNNQQYITVAYTGFFNRGSRA